MKKLCGLITFILVFLILPVTALADTAGSSAAPQTTQDTTSGTSFAIDNANIYDGMDKAYKDGYTLTVKNGVATVVLPLVSNVELKGNTLTATPGLGDTATSPFVFKNYQKTVNLASNTVSGGAKISSYLVRFDISLNSNRINGVYPITMDIKAQGKDGATVQQAFTSYITITDGKAPVSTEAPVVEKPTSQPKIIVSSYTVNPPPVVAGKEFTATVTLKNTSVTKAIQNMTVTVACDSPKFALENSSDTIFVSKVGVGKTTDVNLKYKTDLDTPAQGFNITLTMSYDNAEATALTSVGVIKINVTQPLKVELTAPQIAANVNAGDTIPLSFQVMNMGRSKIYNVRCELNAPGFIPSNKAFIGNMEAGVGSKADMDVFIGTKNMTEGYKGKDKYGLTNGKITLIYEDETGKEYKQDTDFISTIKEPVVAEAAPSIEVKKAGQWWISIVIGVILIAGLSAVLIIRKKKENYHEDL